MNEMNEVNTNEIVDVAVSEATNAGNGLIKTIGIGAAIAAAVTGVVFIAKKLIKKHKRRSEYEVVDNNEPIVEPIVES